MLCKTDKRLPAAVVIGLESMTGLQTSRILARHGIAVIGVTSNPHHPCSRTNVCERVLVGDTSRDALVEVLAKLGRELHEKAVLYPCSDPAVAVVSRHREALAEWYQSALPSHTALQMLADKGRFYKYAVEHGFPVPATFTLANRDDALAAAQQLRFPCILKPRAKSLSWDRNSKIKAFKVRGRQAFLETYQRCAGWTDVLVAQEWIEGPDSHLYSCNCYFNANSEPLVTFIARKLRQWPPEAGTSCLGEECRNDFVLEHSLRLFREVRLYGLGYLEIKQDSRDGRYFLIEPNIGRPTGRSAIAEAGGVDLLFTMYCDQLGMPLPPNLHQKYSGAKWIYFRRDLQSAYYYWKRGQLTVSEWLRSWRGVRADALFSWKDPAPFFLDFANAAAKLVRGDPVA